MQIIIKDATRNLYVGKTDEDPNGGLRDVVQSFGEIRYLEFIQDIFTPLPMLLS